MKPPLSVITLTYARPELLEVAVKSFLEQDYEGPSELVVINSFPEQHLLASNIVAPIDHTVRIGNLLNRPKSLGECRNLAIASATHDIIVTLDDDDVLLPHYLSTVASCFTDDVDWVWQSKMFWCEKHGEIRSIEQGAQALVAFRKRAWQELGGYAAVNSGEDRNFVGRLTARFPGFKYNPPDDKIGYIYRWGQPDTYHISGHYDQFEYARVDHYARKRIGSGTLETGKVTITPRWDFDWPALAGAFLKKKEDEKPKPGSVCVVLLGRLGDIVNILPVMKHMAEAYQKPYLMISREFAGLLDGVSYVYPVPVPFTPGELDKAMAEAQQTFTFVHRAQIWAMGMKQDRRTEAYNLESWNQLGFADKFSDPDFRLVFDRRNLEREQRVIEKLNPSGKPAILVAHKGMSSPFDRADLLLARIKQRWGHDYSVVDISGMLLPKPYDLLGLMDAAKCLVTVDTFPLHLAAASKVPVVALVNPAPWLRSKPRCNTIAVFKYDQVKHFDGVHEAIGKAVM